MSKSIVLNVDWYIHIYIYGGFQFQITRGAEGYILGDPPQINPTLFHACM